MILDPSGRTWEKEREVGFSPEMDHKGLNTPWEEPREEKEEER